MFSECLVSIHLLIFIIGGTIYNTTSSEYVFQISSFLSPVCMVVCYYFNACFAQNLYLTFFPQGDYRKRFKVYKYVGLSLIIISTIFSILLSSSSNANSSNVIMFSYYQNWILIVLYSIGLVVLFYVALKLYYVFNRSYHYFRNFQNEKESECKY